MSSTDIDLPAPKPADAAAPVRGTFDACTKDGAFGWAMHVEGGLGAVEVELWIDGQARSRSVADLPRDDLAAAGYGDGCHAFRLEWPDGLFDDQPHAVEVRTARGGEVLPGGPREVRFGRDAAATEFVGTLDTCDHFGAVGWAARADAQDGPVELELLVDGEPRGRALAQHLRADLAAAGMGSGRHGFILPLPEVVFDGRPHSVSVVPVGASRPLNGSPMTLRVDACEHFKLTPPDDVLARQLRAGAALDQIEAMPDLEAGLREHDLLLDMQAWLQGRPFVRTQERVRAQLDRLAALRSRLEIDGLIDGLRIEGRLIDSWGEHAGLALELLEGETAVNHGATAPDGRFAIAVPEALRDGRLHAFSLRVPAFGATLGPWQFLLVKTGADDPPISGAVWDVTPRTKRAAAKPTAVPPTRLELAHAAATEMLAQSQDADPERTVRAVLDLAEAMMDAGEWAAARQEFYRAQTLDADNLIAVVGEVRAVACLGDDRTALRLAREAIRRFPAEGSLLRLADELAGRRRLHDARVIAFYLPQFHPIPENNRWWGEGFTEWSNVAAATPLFDGHLQPRRPTSLGFYDLRLPEAANAQFELARRYGIDGFCYYYYWFDGRRVLERPLQDLVEGRTGPFPFCICWANEDWTRSWDGESGEVLLAQNHSEASDLRFIQDLEPLLRHPDYIRVEGRPMVLIYRADKLAKPKETVEHWREWCRRQGIGELYLCAVQSFGFEDPRPFGLDAAVEFPPHCLWERYRKLEYIKELPEPPGIVSGFAGKIYDWQSFARAAMARPREPYPLLRTAMAAWDNTARRQKTAHVYHGFTVDAFERWVEHNARTAAFEHKDAVCFINAWNEWAEGTVMEPDAHFGHEILEATRRARLRAHYAPQTTFWTRGRPQLVESRLEAREHVLLVGHDAFPAGAQTNLLNMARCLKRQLDTDVSVMLLEGGALLADYERVAPTYVIGTAGDWRDKLAPRIAALAARGVRKALCNTVLTGDVAEFLKSHGFRVAGLIHELPALIAEGSMQARCWRMADKADALVFASQTVARAFSGAFWPDADKLLVAPQGIVLNAHVAQREKARAEVRRRLGIAPRCAIVMGCGYGDTRKGIDLFVQLAGKVRARLPGREVHFVWVGDLSDAMRPYVRADIERLRLHAHLHVTGHTKEAPLFFAAADLFALTSREDPFPSVVMEAFDAHLPVLAFDGAGGFVDIVDAGTGALLPYLDVDAMAATAAELLGDDARRAAVGEHNHRLCRERFTYEPYMRKLLALLAGVPAEQVAAGLLQRQPWFGPRARPTISVIVPNYNYGRYLELRLRTILAQSLPPDEIIVLDDASTDGSLDIAHAIAASSPIPMRVVASAANSGSPFVQWARGLEMASGELVWIAEADDYCEPTLLETLAAEFREDDGTVLAWCDSVMVDEQGDSKGAQYKSYYAKRYGAKWGLSFRIDGRELIDDCLLTENVLPNASAIVFRRAAVRAEDLALIQAHRFSGDWWLWIALAAAGRVSYLTAPLNYHRRHGRSVMGQVLRAGAGLIGETLAFYERLVQRKPELITRQAMPSVYGRLEQLYRMFPAQLAQAPRLSEHPEHGPALLRLMRQAAQAMSTGRPTELVGLLVASAEALDTDGPGPDLLRRFEQASGLDGLDLVVLHSEDSPVPVLQPDLRRVRVTLLRADQAELPSMLAMRTKDAGALASIGLRAHCALAELSSDVRGSWLLVAGSDFDRLLGVADLPDGVTLDRLSAAVASASALAFVGERPSHAFARAASSRRLPIERLRLPEAAPDRARALRLVALADDATPAQWREVALALDDADTGDLCFSLIHADGLSDEFRRVHASSPRLQALFVPGRPIAKQTLGDLFLVRETALVAPAGADTLALDAFLASPKEALAPFLRQWRRHAPPASATAPTGPRP